MAPTETDFAGYWGKPTATIDWCEANYEISYYFAEFWNTVSNVFMIIPPLVGAILAVRDGLESRFLWCHLSIMMVGIGSWCFHGTLLYGMQLLDELPMIWGSSFLLYSLMEVDGNPKSENKLLQRCLFLYSAVVTLVYLTIKKPIFHEVAYGLMVFAMLVASIRIMRKYKHSFVLFIFGLGSYVLGFVIWNLDNVFCRQLRETRADLPSPVRPLFQGHAWWHILAGSGTYLSLLFTTHARMKYLRKEVQIETKFGIWPCVRSTSAKTTHNGVKTTHNNNLYK